jgi:hypothetical protein
LLLRGSAPPRDLAVAEAVDEVVVDLPVARMNA